MRLAHVHGEKIGVFFVIVINLNDVGYLPTEGGSSKTAKHQHERPPGSFLANMKSARPIEGDQARVRSVAAHFERAAMHVRQRIAHHAVGVLRAACHIGEEAKSRD